MVELNILCTTAPYHTQDNKIVRLPDRPSLTFHVHCQKKSVMFIFESRVLQIDYFSYNGPPTEYDGN